MQVTITANALDVTSRDQLVHRRLNFLRDDINELEETLVRFNAIPTSDGHAQVEEKSVPMELVEQSSDRTDQSLLKIEEMLQRETNLRVWLSMYTFEIAEWQRDAETIIKNQHNKLAWQEQTIEKLWMECAKLQQATGKDSLTMCKHMEAIKRRNTCH